MVAVSLFLLAAAIFVLALVLFLQFRQRMQVRTRVEREQQERVFEKAKRQIAVKQNEVINTLFAELRQAAHQNKVASSPLEIYRPKPNAGLGYSISVYIPDPSGISVVRDTPPGFSILQIDINLERVGKEIHVIKVTGGSKRDYSRAEFDALRIELYEWVEYYPQIK